jgi:hypothetical protein
LKLKKGERMSKTIEGTIVQETQSLQSLMDAYNSVKANASDATNKLTNSFTLKGMDSINEMVSEAMEQIAEFTTNGKKQGAFAAAGNKALAIIDPKSKWAGKWLGNASTEVKKEALKEKTLNEIIDNLIAQINTKREEVITFIESATSIRSDMITSISAYETLQTSATTLLNNAVENSRESFDAKFLITQLTTTIQGIKTDITSHVDPLIAGASVSVNQIATILPTIENDLKYKSGFKVFQQNLSDLNGMVKSVTNLATNAGDAIRKDVNSTIIDSLAMLGETGVDTERLAKVHEEQMLHQKAIDKVMSETKDKINNNFNNMQQLQLKMDEERLATNSILIAAYSKEAKTL